MRRDLDRLLCDRYPTIFRDRYADMRTTAMCWGFDHGDGWFALLDVLCAEIDQHVAATGCRPVVASQIKEKYGALNFYYSGGNEFINGLVLMAEALSERVCEECGAVGRMNSGGWLWTRCRDHWRDLTEDYDEPVKPAIRHVPSKRGSGFKLPPVATPGWQHLSAELEAVLANEVNRKSVAPIVVEGVEEGDALRLIWSGGNERTAGIIGYSEAISRRLDRQTGSAT